MTIESARKILGKKYEDFSDDQILNLIKQIKNFTDVCVENIDNRIKKEGTNFLYMASKEVK